MKHLSISTAVLILFLLGFSYGLSARHIIGGVITYDNLGGGNYRFTMRIYRDCFCTNCAELDQQAFVAVYRCGTDISCNSMNQNSWFLRVDVPLTSVTNVIAPDYPCLIPPAVCVEEGLYVFDLNLPLSAESYHISYQRCCRNITINNIIGSEDTGATYTIEITPEAQQLGNSSPVFNDFPPTVICAGAALEFDHSASDINGDQLVYSFCPPLRGGGPLLSPDTYNTCGGANPNPACPPPYNPVSFSVPTYNSLQPMGGDPVVTIDPNSGLITGTPLTQGQFVVGVCVSEFRNGELLSQVFRDFQFNVASCDPTVVADILEDEIIGDQEFLINSCGNNSVTFINQSFQQNFIDVFEWRFDINGNIQTFDQWNPTVTFPGIGQYEGQLILNPSTDCGDTAYILVNVFPDIHADFTFEYDTCVAGPVAFTDLSQTGADMLTGWQWNFGDGNTSITQDPLHTYMIPGALPVTLSVTDNNECEADTTIAIPYFPVPALIVIAPSTFVGCAPGEIFFDNLSFPIDDTYDIFWDFGDGGSSQAISPTHVFESPGIYTISVEIVSPIGCQIDTLFPNWITILPAPEAGFSFFPENPSNILPTVDFSDESTGGVRWFWDFGGGGTSIRQNPTFTFRDTGRFEVKQIVTHPSGCQDTLIRIIDVVPEIRYFLPNAFTPNNDTVNDFFRGVGMMEGSVNFKMTIWNRWGEMVFITSDPKEGWNGRKLNSGRDAPNGVYPVLVTFTGPRGLDYEIKGLATLVR